MSRSMVTLDANEAAAYIAHQVSEVIAIYPITPSSAMGEWADQWSAESKKNIWGTTPLVVEMQSEGGAAGAVHGALQTGSLTTTFTASQGLLLMLPNMYKIAGELTSTVFHIAARALAAQALSIFGDHQDVMAARMTGWALLCSNSVQEVMDFALMAHAATLQARVPFLHFFDGFRTSSEVMKIEQLDEDDLRYMIDDDLVRAHRARALSPDNPFLRGAAQNPDVYFQGRETVNPYYAQMPEIMQATMDQFAQRVGRQYHLFDYVGAPDADRVIVIMGSGGEVAQETVEFLNAHGAKVGVLKVHLFRPFSVKHFIHALPATVQKIAVLDRTKEPGSAGEPLYQDVVTALMEGWESREGEEGGEGGEGREGGEGNRRMPRVIGGRYGLASKEFTPAMVKGIFDELERGDHQGHPYQGRPLKNHFTIGINDDVSHTSLDYDPDFSTEDPSIIRAMFYGLGADGTVGANKNSIKIIGDETDLYAQGYFVYDSKKSGSTTTSHLRFGPKPIHSSYLIRSANFVACHQFSFLERFEMLDAAQDGAVFLLNSPYGPDQVWEHLPRSVQEQILAKHLQFYVIDAYAVARETEMGARINTVMQTCFFAISGVLPRDEAIAAIKHAIEKTYGKRGEPIVRKNFAAVDATLEHLHQVQAPARVTSTFDMRPPVAAGAPEFIQKVTAEIIAGRGDALPVSVLPVDGTYPSGSARWEKRNITLEVPVWDENICIQCGKCVFVCPHAVIRAKVYDPKYLQGAPETFKSVPARWKEFEGMRYTLQVSPEDCTGCTLCVEVCPVKNKSEARLKAVNMAPQSPIREAENANWAFFEKLPEMNREKLAVHLVKDNQLLQPLFEFSGACAGCGETPYIKLITQLFGDRAYVANATGCSSIFGGNLPTTPWSFNAEGRGPAWSNSLFEDNAEFGLGFRLTLDKRLQFARELLPQFTDAVGGELVDGILNAVQTSEAEILKQRGRVQHLKEKLEAFVTQSPNAPMTETAQHFLSIADIFVKKSVWIVGGDGWAYDIGYGGLDHVLASGRNVNVLVLDTEVYSNTGGQMSKATPRGAVAKFAAGGKPTAKKDLAMLAMTYSSIYVARVAMGASDSQTVKAFLEAEAYDGPSLIIAYAHCIAHGYDMARGLDQQKAAVQSAYWPLFRYDPRLAALGKNPLQLDSKAPTLPLEKYVYNETRYTMLKQSNEAAAEHLLALEKQDVANRWKMYEQLAQANGKESK
ncbi:MAG: pyruvate:ferredoxin (flavodoxin) oxidoreductase [Chloroflexi bacterium]|nr:pyruvate:ferredoxin (flavodoxin) oxidoreductase [Chloroflexota bacterium]